MPRFALPFYLSLIFLHIGGAVFDVPSEVAKKMQEHSLEEQKTRSFVPFKFEIAKELPSDLEIEKSTFGGPSNRGRGGFGGADRGRGGSARGGSTRGGSTRGGFSPRGSSSQSRGGFRGGRGGKY
jgi:hypothetical protein